MFHGNSEFFQIPWKKTLWNFIPRQNSMESHGKFSMEFHGVILHRMYVDLGSKFFATHQYKIR